jgi:hypothetical protein
VGRSDIFNPPCKFAPRWLRVAAVRERIDMTESVSSLENDARAIQALSEKLKVPELKVIEVYRTEFNRLAAQSRIETFLGVLAMRNTKSILRNTSATDKR